MTSLKQNDRFFFLLLEVSTKGDLNIVGPTGQTQVTVWLLHTLQRKEMVFLLPFATDTASKPRLQKQLFSI